MGAFFSGLGAAAQNYAQHRLERSGIGRAIQGGVNRYRQAQQQAANPSPATHMDRSPVAEANPALTPPGQDEGMQQPIGYADEVGGDPQQQSNTYGGQGAAAFDAGDQFSGSMDGIQAMGSGAVVTRPTIALVGEHQPEMVLPLLSQPGQKVSSEMLGQGLGMKTRWRRPSGPNASARYKPERADVPLRPSGVNR